MSSKFYFSTTAERLAATVTAAMINAGCPYTDREEGKDFMPVVRGTGASCWRSIEDVAAQTGLSETNTYWVDRGTTNPTAQQTGSRWFPFKTISQAITAALAVTAGNFIQTINVIGGDYDEDLAWDHSARQLRFVAHGQVNLGDFGGSGWAPQNTRRNITVTGNGTAVGTAASPLLTFERAGNASPANSTKHAWRISGKVDFSGMTSTGSFNLDLAGMRVYGSNGSSTGDSILGPAALSSSVNLINCRIVDVSLTGKMTGNLSVSVTSGFTQFLGAVSVWTLNRCLGVQFGSNITVGANNSQLFPLMNCYFSGGTLTGVAGNFYVDGNTAYEMATSSITVATCTLTVAEKILPVTTLDLSGIAAATAALKATATSDTPSTTYTAHVASNDPAGFIKIDIGGVARYIPYYA